MGLFKSVLSLIMALSGCV